MHILRALVANRAPQSAPELARQAGLSPQGVRLILETLAQQQLVKVHGTGRSLLCALNESHPLAGALVVLFQAEQQRGEQLIATIRDLLVRHGIAMCSAWLYGSVARAEDMPRSDMDIASCDVADQVREGLMSQEDEQHLRISLTALTPKELAALPDEDHWWTTVVRETRVLKGSAPETAKRQVTKAVA